MSGFSSFHRRLSCRHSGVLCLRVSANLMGLARQKHCPSRLFKFCTTSSYPETLLISSSYFPILHSPSKWNHASLHDLQHPQMDALFTPDIFRRRLNPRHTFYASPSGTISSPLPPRNLRLDSEPPYLQAHPRNLHIRSQPPQWLDSPRNNLHRAPPHHPSLPRPLPLLPTHPPARRHLCLDSPRQLPLHHRPRHACRQLAPPHDWRARDTLL